MAMPAAAKLMADNNLAAGSVAGTGKDGRVTKGDVLSAVAGGVQSTAAVIPTGAPTKALPQVTAPSVSLGDRPEQRVPMTRLRARVAERLLQHAPPHSLVARLGGDEFAILLHHNDTGADTTEAQALAARLVTALSRPYQIKERRLRVGASVGIALIDGEVTHVDELLVRADIALYDAKAHGRGRAAAAR